MARHRSIRFITVGTPSVDDDRPPGTAVASTRTSQVAGQSHGGRGTAPFAADSCQWAAQSARAGPMRAGKTVVPLDAERPLVWSSDTGVRLSKPTSVEP